MGQRGQITIFIILAIILFGVILIFFSSREGLIQDILTPEINSINLFVQDCVEKEGLEVIYNVGQNGGYYFPTELSTESGIPYYFIEKTGENHMPSKTNIENEISFYLERKLFFCTKNFINFPEFEIILGEPKFETEIKETEVILDVNYPLSIRKGNSTSIIENFRIELPIRLGIIYDSIYEIIQKQLTHEGICLSCIYDISIKNDFYVNLIDHDEKTVAFFITDENSKINNEPFVFIFANEYE